MSCFFKNYSSHLYSSSQPQSPLPESSSINFPLSLSSTASSLLLATALGSAGICSGPLDLHTHKPFPQTSLSLLSLLPAKRLNKATCSAYASSSPTHSSFQSNMALALTSLQFFSGMSQVTPNYWSHPT